MRRAWPPETRELVIRLHGEGKSWASIEEATGVPRQTAWSMVNYYGRPRPVPRSRRTVPGQVTPGPWVTPPGEPPVVIGPPADRVAPGSALVNVLDMAALWVRAAADKMLTEKVRAEDRKAMVRLEDAWSCIQGGKVNGS
jgi:hypothetical protein